MAINYNIQAEVVDIRSDTPKDDDLFFVDTNAWYWQTYSRVSSIHNPHPPLNYQIKHYPNYIKKIICSKAKILRCDLILAEIAHIIEKTEYDIYCNENHKTIKQKEFRHNFPKQREQVADEIEMVWETIRDLSEPLKTNIGDVTSEFIVREIRRSCLDSYDLIYLHNLLQNSENPKDVKVVTDDGDFTTFPRIMVFTANKNVILAAKNNGKLISRD